MQSFIIFLSLIVLAIGINLQIDHEKQIAQKFIKGIFKHSYKLYKLSDYKDAKCLDGSPPAYYFSKYQRTSGQKKFIIFFEGGGWCGDSTIEKTLEQCYNRSLTDLGSSKNYPLRVDDLTGIMSGDQQVNPFFYDWNRIYVKYCDGTGRQGYNTEPYIYNNSQVWFRGMNNTLAFFNDIAKKFDLKNAEQVMLSGCSAGGLSVYTWTNYLREFLPSKVQMWSVSDSGFFLDYQSIFTQGYLYRSYFENFMFYSNRQADPPIPQCVKDNSNEKWKCMFAYYQQQYITVPLFLTQFEYDTWQMYNILGEDCYNTQKQMAGCNNSETENIELFRYFSLQQVIESTNLQKNRGVWFSACLGHCMLMARDLYNSPDYTVLEHTTNTLAYSVYKFINNITDEYDFKYIDPLPWPSNRPCSGVDGNFIIQ